MIQITFTPETPEQAAVVADAISKYLGAVGPVKDEAPVAEVPKPKTRKTVTVVATEPSPEVPSATESVPTDPTPTVSLEEVRAVLAQLSQAGKAADVKNLITTFGAAKLTDIASDKYSDLLAAAKAL